MLQLNTMFKKGKIKTPKNFVIAPVAQLYL